MVDLLLKNAHLVTDSDELFCDIAVQNEKVVAICCPGIMTEASKTIDCAGKYVLPGAVDMHVHFNDPGVTHREDFFTGTSAAAAGGTTTVVDMPLANRPATIDPGAVGRKLQAASKRAIVDYGIWGGLVADNTMKLEGMHSLGVAGFKAFTCDAGEDFPFVTNDVLYRGMEQAKRLGALVGVHCEDNSLIRMLQAQAVREGRNRAADFLAAHAPVTERAAVDAVLEIAKATGARTHICHASMPEVVERVRQAKELGFPVTVETCPHYLLFSESNLIERGAVLKCTPPVRDAEQAEAMWGHVVSGDIDVICSDHSPSSPEEKNPLGGRIWDAWGGLSGVQTLLPVMFSEGVVKRGWPVGKLVELLSANPAKLLGIYPKKGTIQVGTDADLAILDPGVKWNITGDGLFYKHKQTPYLNMTLQGKVACTILRGRVVFVDNRITARPGYGKFIPMAR